MQKYFTINQFSLRTNVSPSTLRMWDKLGLLKALRTIGGQRRYSEDMINLAVKEVESKEEENKKNQGE